jgi:hypothetical protein
MIFYKRINILIINWLRENGIFLLAIYSILFFLTAKNKKHIIEFFDLPINIKIDWIIGLPIIIFLYFTIILVVSWNMFKFLIIFPYLFIKGLFNINVNSKIVTFIEEKWEYIFLIFYLFMLIYFAMHWFNDFSFYKT